METIDAVVVVADAGPLIHLDELSALDLLGDYSAVWVPQAVWHEVTRHRPQALQHSTTNLICQSLPAPSAQVQAIKPIYGLHQGECEALTLCLNHAINVLFTDDTAARLAAQSVGVAAHGTLGLIIRSVRRQLRTPHEALALLAAIPAQTTLHIRPSLLADVIRCVQTEWRI